MVGVLGGHLGLPFPRHNASQEEPLAQLFYVNFKTRSQDEITKSAMKEQEEAPTVNVSVDHLYRRIDLPPDRATNKTK